MNEIILASCKDKCTKFDLILNLNTLYLYGQIINISISKKYNYGYVYNMKQVDYYNIDYHITFNYRLTELYTFIDNTVTYDLCNITDNILINRIIKIQSLKLKLIQ
jgi:hypothetical protein